jgi:predicted dehydrogenase
MRFGVLGTASIATSAFIPAVRNTEHRVSAIASREADRAAAVAREFDIPEWYDNYEELLSDGDIEAVYVPLPNSLHAKWTIKAAEQGLHVLCEKPLATSPGEAKTMCDRCAEAGVQLMEAFMYRYHPLTERAIEVARDYLDEVRSMTACYQSPRSGNLVSLNPDLGGGSLMHNGCYAVDAARAVLGNPRRVYANESDAQNAGVDTQFTGLLEYSDGATAVISSGYDTHRSVARYRVEATNGWLETNTAFITATTTEGELRYAIGDRSAVETFSPVDPYAHEITHFVECVRTGQAPRTSGKQGIANMTVIDALYESAASNQAVEVGRDD